MASPSVSLIIPHFNRHELLRETLATVGLFARPGDQVTVVDDGSDPTTVTHVEGLLSELPRHLATQLVRHGRNRGGAAARNSGVRASEHDWIFCLDSDNLLTVGLLEALVDAAVSQQLDVAVPEYTVFFQGQTRIITHAWRYPQRAVLPSDHFSRQGIVPSASGNYLFSRNSWERAGGYPEDVTALDAWGFGLRQTIAGCAMTPVKGTCYLHRYGHASYWTSANRETLSHEIDQLVCEHPELNRLILDDQLRRRRRLNRRRFRIVWEKDLFPTVALVDLPVGERITRRLLPNWVIRHESQLASPTPG